MNTTSATASGANVPGSSGSPNPDNDPPLLRIPGELRNKIYAFATSCSSPLIVGLPVRAKDSWQLPALAEVSKQVRQEAVSIFFECNTLRIHNLRRATLWYPFRSPTHMQNITALFLEISSSRNWYLTLKAFNIQPTLVLKEVNGAVNLLVGKDDVSGYAKIVEERDFDVVVKWEPFERAIESLAKHPRPHLFLTLDQLEEAWVEENQRQADISRRSAGDRD